MQTAASSASEANARIEWSPLTHGGRSTSVPLGSIDVAHTAPTHAIGGQRRIVLACCVWSSCADRQLAEPRGRAGQGPAALAHEAAWAIAPAGSAAIVSTISVVVTMALA